MQFAAMLYFDGNTDKEVDKQIKRLKELTNNEYMLDNNMPAHITLAMWNSEYDFAGEIKGFAESVSAFDVRFSSMGFFNDEERHVFLSPVMNERLAGLHSGLYEAIILPDEKDYIKMYKDTDIWVPHLTVAYQVEKENFGQVLSMCADIKLPITAHAEKIALAVCCPFREIGIFSFNK